MAIFLKTVFKKQVLYNQYHEDLAAFRDACIEFFMNIDQHAESITSIMSGGFEIDYSQIDYSETE